MKITPDHDNEYFFSVGNNKDQSSRFHEIIDTRPNIRRKPCGYPHRSALGLLPSLTWNPFEKGFLEFLGSLPPTPTHCQKVRVPGFFYFDRDNNMVPNDIDSNHPVPHYIKFSSAPYQTRLISSAGFKKRNFF